MRATIFLGLGDLNDDFGLKMSDATFDADTSHLIGNVAPERENLLTTGMRKLMVQHG